jgi:hypothetical protein
VHLAPVSHPSAPFSFFILVHEHKVQLHWRRRNPPSLFFFPMAEVVNGAINGDQAKGCTSDQLLFVLAVLCKGEKVCKVII